MCTQGMNKISIKESNKTDTFEKCIKRKCWLQMIWSLNEIKKGLLSECLLVLTLEVSFNLREIRILSWLSLFVGSSLVRISC